MKPKIIECKLKVDRNDLIISVDAIDLVVYHEGEGVVKFT